MWRMLKPHAQIDSLRKLLSTLLLAGFMLPLLAPLLALGQDDEARLPACCRRNGQHHCMMSMSERNQLAGKAQFRAPMAKCPYSPGSVMSMHVERWGKPETADAVFAGFISHPGGSPQTESKRRISRDRSRQERGPPNTFLS